MAVISGSVGRILAAEAVRNAGKTGTTAFASETTPLIAPPFPPLMELMSTSGTMR
jgi:hypothetical protein